MHEMRGADDRVDRADVAAVHAADAQGFVDNGNCGLQLFGQWYRFAAQQTGETLNGGVATRRAEVNRGRALDDGRRVRVATRIPTLCTLCLWEEVINLLHEVAAAGWQTS